MHCQHVRLKCDSLLQIEYLLLHLFLIESITQCFFYYAHFFIELFILCVERRHFLIIHTIFDYFITLPRTLYPLQHTLLHTSHIIRVSIHQRSICTRSWLLVIPISDSQLRQTQLFLPLQKAHQLLDLLYFLVTSIRVLRCGFISNIAVVDFTV